MIALKHIATNITVTPMRPEYSAKSFASNDVPHGTDSVYYKAAMVLNQNHAANIGLPQFTAQQKADLVTAKLALVSVIDMAEKDEDGHLVHDPMTTDMTLKVPAADAKEIEAEMAKDVMSDMPGIMVVTHLTEQQARTKLEDAKKLDLAKHLVDRDIDQCLIVPAIPDSFKALFTEIEIPAQ